MANAVVAARTLASRRRVRGMVIAGSLSRPERTASLRSGRSRQADGNTRSRERGWRDGDRGDQRRKGARRGVTVGVGGGGQNP